jgi:hypothetical protein
MTASLPRFDADLYGAFPVKRLFFLVLLTVLCSERERPFFVACDQVRGARGRGQGTETLAELGGLPSLASLVFRSALTPEHAEGR